MDSYKVLKQQIFTSGEYSLVPIRYEDRMNIMKWRNEQMYHLRQSEPLTEASQNYYFDNVVKQLFNEDRPKQILFSFLKNDECIGYGGLVHINYVDRNAEISFIMDTKLETDSFEALWNIYLEVIENVAFQELNLHKLYTYAFEFRTKLFLIFEALGYQCDARLNSHCLFENKYIDVVIHYKLNYENENTRTKDLLTRN